MRRLSKLKPRQASTQWVSHAAEAGPRSSEPEEQGLKYRNSNSLLSVSLGCREVILMPSHWQGFCSASPPTVMSPVLCTM